MRGQGRLAMLAAIERCETSTPRRECKELADEC